MGSSVVVVKAVVWYSAGSSVVVVQCGSVGNIEEVAGIGGKCGTDDHANFATHQHPDLLL